MPFILFTLALLGGMQIYFFSTADRTQKSIAAQIFATQTQKSMQNEQVMEEFLSVFLQDIVRRHGVSGVDLEKGLHQKLGTALTGAQYTPTSAALAAAEKLTIWNKINVGLRDYQFKVINSSQPKDPAGWVDVALCPRMTEGDSSGMNRTVRLRMSFKQGFSNAIAGHNLNCVFCHAETFGNIAEFGAHRHDKAWGTRVYGNWYSANPPVKHYEGGDIETDDVVTRFTDAQMKASDFFRPAALPEDDINASRVMIPWPTGEELIWGYRDKYYTLDKTEFAYDGPHLGWNPHLSTRSLPKFNPEMARITATGTLTAPMIVVPLGQSVSSMGITEPPTTVSTIGPNADTGITLIDGNLFIDGRTTPIEIKGRIFVSGDIVVMGRYSGQGSLVSGRNIYVADDLTALTPPADLDKSLAANQRLAEIHDPAVAEVYARDNWAADRMLLLATNSVVLGMPFLYKPVERNIAGHKFLEPLISSDPKLLLRTSLENFYKESLFVEKATGMVGIAHALHGSSTHLCVTLPWEDTAVKCAAQNPDGSYVSTARFKQLFVQSDAVIAAAGTGDAASGIATMSYVPEGYYELFYPFNVSDKATGSLAPWISEAEFRAMVRTPADFANSTAVDACGMPKRVTYSPIPSRNYPNQSTSAQIRSEVDAVSGFLTKYGDKKVIYQEKAWGPNDNYTVRELFDRFVGMCADYRDKPVYQTQTWGNAVQPTVTGKDPTLTLVADPSEWNAADASCTPEINADKKLLVMDPLTGKPAIDPGTGEAIEIAKQVGPVTNTDVWQKRYAAEDWAKPMSAYTCSLYFYANRSTCAAGEPDSFFVDAAMQQYDDSGEFGNQFWPYLDEHTANRQLVRIAHRKGAGCNPTGRYFYYWINEPKPAGHLMTKRQNVLGLDKINLPSADAADFHWKLYGQQDGSTWTRSNIWVRSIADDKTDFIQNRIRRIDAFLFANQFVMSTSDTMHDKQLAVNGGLAAREILAMFSSNIGPDRPATGADGFSHMFGGFQSTSLVTTWDPRYMFAEDILQDDFGKTESRRSAGEACQTVSWE